MPRLAYVDGRTVPLADAHIRVEDRGMQFADGIYEVCAILNRRRLDWPLHAQRLTRNLSALEIAAPMSLAALDTQIVRLIAANRVSEALLYIQITRGTAKRDHGFPAAGTRPTLVMTVRPFDFGARVPLQTRGIAIASVNDQRWGRCDIKTTGLLANALAKQTARAAGAFEAWLVDDHGIVAEGSSTNAWIVQSGTIVTHPLSARILPGIARATTLRLARAAGIAVVERPFSLAEARKADEAFITSTTAPVIGVASLDGHALPAPGPVTQALSRAMWAEIERQTGYRP